VNDCPATYELQIENENSYSAKETRALNIECSLFDKTVPKKWPSQVGALAAKRSTALLDTTAAVFWPDTLQKGRNL
jgi:hypothetical protein